MQQAYDENISLQDYIEDPVIFWTPSISPEKGYKCWLWDGQVARQDFRTTVNDMKRNFSHMPIAEWPEASQKTLTEIGIFDIKHCAKYDDALIKTESLRYLAEQQYECTDMLLLQVETEVASTWAIVLSNGAKQYFGLDLSGAHTVTERAYPKGLADFFVHNAKKFGPKTDENPEYLQQFTTHFGKKSLLGETTPLYKALMLGFNAVNTIENDIFPIMREFILHPHKSSSGSMEQCQKKLQDLIANGTNVKMCHFSIYTNVSLFCHVSKCINVSRFHMYKCVIFLYVQVCHV